MASFEHAAASAGTGAPRADAVLLAGTVTPR